MSGAAPAPLPTAPGRFESLDALQAAHAALLKEAGAGDGPAPAALVEFLRRGAATGALLDTAEERQQAQGLLDYWSAKLYAAARRARSATGSDTPPPVPALPFEETLLAKFDAGTVDEAVRAADRWLTTRQRPDDGVGRPRGGVWTTGGGTPPGHSSRPAAESEFARRILLRLVRLPEDRRAFEPAPATRAELAQAVGDAAGADRVIAGLSAAKVLRVDRSDRPEDDRVSLRSEALTRAWAPYRAWLEQRLRFRDAARYWEGSGSDAALISAEPLDEAQTYHDKNDLERRFVEASRRREIRQTRNYRRLAIAFGVLFLFALACAATAVVMWYRADRVARGEREQRRRADGAADEARKATAALQKRQLLADMVDLVRALAQVGSARTPGERRTALNWWDTLREQIAGHQSHLDEALAPLAEKFKTFLADCRVVVDQVKKENAAPEDLEEVLFTALETGRGLKDAMLEQGDAGLRAQYWDRHSKAFLNTRLFTQLLVELLDRGSYKAAAPYVSEFWVLYWGELGLFEGPAVAKGMREFGDQLARVTAALEKGLPPDEREQADSDEFKQYANPELFQKSGPPRKGEPRPRKPAAAPAKKPQLTADVAALRAILEDRLIPALEAELREAAARR